MYFTCRKASVVRIPNIRIKDLKEHMFGTKVWYNEVKYENIQQIHFIMCNLWINLSYEFIRGCIF